MTVSTTISRKAFTGDGTTTVFDIPFAFFNAVDLEVYLIDTSGNVANWVLTTNYTITGGSDAVGTLTALVAPATGYTLLVVRSMTITQSDHFINNDPFDATVMEQALDRLTMYDQQVSDLTGRGIQQPNSDPTAMAVLPGYTSRAGKYLAFDSNGNPITTVEVGSWRGNWATQTIYNIGDVVVDSTNGADTLNVYTCLIAHTAGVWATDLAAGDWVKVIDVVAIGVNAGASALTSLQGTSTTSLTIGTGSQTLTTQGGRNFNVGSFVAIVDSSDITKWMAGQITAYNSTSGSLTVNVTLTGGSGTIATWNVDMSGAPGPAPPAPPGAPTFTAYTSGSGTYTTPAGVKWLRVRMVGGGGGSGAQSTNGGSGGGNTTFGTSFLTAGGGAGGPPANVSTNPASVGGTASGGDINIQGQYGSAVDAIAGTESFGGSSMLGHGGVYNGNSQPGLVGTGYGAGGAGPNTSSAATPGGGAGGGYVEKIITSPAASYAYAVGAAGVGGAAGTTAGANGTGGAIFIEEHYS